jgi:hypothetical protein
LKRGIGKKIGKIHRVMLLFLIGFRKRLLPKEKVASVGTKA